MYGKNLKFITKNTPVRDSAVNSHCHLQLRPEVLFEVDSVADFKNIFQANYKDTQVTFLKIPLLSILNTFLRAAVISEATNQGSSE